MVTKIVAYLWKVYIVFCRSIHCALFDVHIHVHLLHIHIRYTSYQKLNVLVSENGMNDCKDIFLLVKVPVVTVGFLPCVVRLVKKAVIKHGTLQVSRSNCVCHFNFS